MPQLVIVCSSLSVCLLIIVMIVVIITFKSSSRSSASNSSSHEHITDEYLQIRKSSLMLHQTPDILHSHHASHAHQGGPPPLDHHHHHHHSDHKVVWTVPICTSSVKSDIYSDHENYSYIRGPSWDNYDRIDPDTRAYHGHVDLDDSSPGTHV